MNVRLLAAILFLMAPFGVVYSALRDVDRPDFTGTWKMDLNLSSPVKSVSLDDLTLVISQTPVELRVKRVIKEKKRKERVSEATYYTDGRGEKTFQLSILLSNQKWESKTDWFDDTLVRKFATLVVHGVGDGPIPSPEVEALTNEKFTEVWTLSPDHKTLTIKTDTIPPALLRATGQMKQESYSRVFHKVQ